MSLPSICKAPAAQKLPRSLGYACVHEDLEVEYKAPNECIYSKCFNGEFLWYEIYFSWVSVSPLDNSLGVSFFHIS